MDANFAALVEDRQIYDVALKRNKFNFDAILSGLYNDPSHFIYEILQNAEDAAATEVKFSLHADRLEIDHNGKDFVFEDVEGITGVGNSTKTDDLNAIGKFGVGFKSVFAITQTPLIHSGRYHFRIDKFVLPTQIEPLPNVAKTRIILPFNHQTRPPEQVYSLIQIKLQDIGLKTLLFLKNIEDIAWCARDASGRYYKHTEPCKGRDSVMKTSAISESPQGDDFEKYLIISKALEGTGRTIEIAYRLEDNDDGGERIVPETESKLVVYFPTEKETYLEFLIQGPYKTTPNRENIPLTDEGNQMILQATAELVAQSIAIVKDLGLLNVSFLNILPLNAATKQKSEIYSVIYDRVKETLLSDEPFLPTAKAGYATAAQAILARGRELTDYLQEKDLHLLFKRSKWLTTDITVDLTSELRDYLMKELSVREVDFEVFCRSITLDFISQKTDAWLIDFYRRLKNQYTIWQGVLRQKPIVRLETGQHVSIYNREGHVQVYLPSDTHSQYNTIKPALLAHSDVLEFFKQTGVDCPDQYAELVEHVFPTYKQSGDTIEISDDRYLADILKIHSAYKHLHSVKKSQLVEDLKKLCILDSCNHSGEQFLSRPTEVYYPSEGLQQYFSRCPDAPFIKKEVLETLGPDCNEFLKEIGVNYFPRRIECDSPLSSDEKYNLRGRTGVTSEETLDYTLDGLTECLQGITREESTLLWNLLIAILKDLRNIEIDSFFQGTYQWYYYTDHKRHFDASFLKLLKQAKWLYAATGDAKASGELLTSELAPEYETDSTSSGILIKQLQFMPDIVDQLPPEEKTILFLLKEKHITLPQLQEWVKSIEPQKLYPNLEISWTPDCAPADAPLMEILFDKPTVPPGGSPGVTILVAGESDGRITTRHPNEDDVDPNIALKKQSIAQWGEEYVCRILKERYAKYGSPEDTEYGFKVASSNETYEIEWLNKNGDRGTGCDFLIKVNAVPESYIEVKSKEGTDTEFLMITGKQWHFAATLNKQRQGQKYWLYVVNDAGKESVHLTKICNPVEKWKDGLLYAHPVNIKL